MLFLTQGTIPPLLPIHGRLSASGDDKPLRNVIYWLYVFFTPVLFFNRLTSLISYVFGYTRLAKRKLSFVAEGVRNLQKQSKFVAILSVLPYYYATYVSVLRYLIV